MQNEREKEVQKKRGKKTEVKKQIKASSMQTNDHKN